MTRFWGRVSGAVVVAGIAAGWTPGCAHNDSTLFVLGVLAPQLVTPGTQCVYTSDPTQELINSGTLDLDLRRQGSYDATLLVGNQMLSQVSTSAPRTETSYVNVQGAFVTIRDLSGTVLSQYTDYSSATIPPASGPTPSYAPINITLVDSATAAAVGTGNVLTAVRFFGKTLGGQSVESEEFQFPIGICRGCLVQFLASDVNAAFRSPNCVGTGQAPMSEPCRPGQDWPLDCAFCKSYAAECNPATTAIGGDGGGATTDASGAGSSGADAAPD